MFKRELFLGVGKPDIVDPMSFVEKCDVRIIRRASDQPAESDDCEDFLVREIFNDRTLQFDKLTDKMLSQAGLIPELDEDTDDGADQSTRTRSRKRKSTVSVESLAGPAKVQKRAGGRSAAVKKEKATVVDSGSESDWEPSDDDEDARAAKQQSRASGGTRQSGRGRKAGVKAASAKKTPARKQSVAKKRLSLGDERRSQLPARLADAEVSSTPLDRACSR